MTQAEPRTSSGGSHEMEEGASQGTPQPRQLEAAGKWFCLELPEEPPAHTSLSAQGTVWAAGSGLFGAAGNVLSESIWSRDRPAGVSPTDLGLGALCSPGTPSLSPRLLPQSPPLQPRPNMPAWKHGQGSPQRLAWTPQVFCQ